MTSADNSYVLVSLGGLSMVGLMVQLFFSGQYTKDGSNGPANATVWGYGLVTVAVASLMFVSFALSTNIQRCLQKPAGVFVRELVEQSVPPMSLLLVVGWIVGLNVSYWTRINQGQVPAEYTQFSRLSTIMIAAEIMLLMKWLSELSQLSEKHTGCKSEDSNQPPPSLTPEERSKKSYSSQIRYISYLLSLVNLVFAGMMTVVLKYFTTDG
jgi:hypothetical protein